jgi:hypothetical protein
MNKFNSDLGLGIKGLIVIRSNLVVTWKDKPQMNIISQFPLGLRWFTWVGCTLGYFLQLNFQFVPKQNNHEIEFALVGIHLAKGVYYYTKYDI